MVGSQTMPKVHYSVHAQDHLYIQSTKTAQFGICSQDHYKTIKKQPLDHITLDLGSCGLYGVPLYYLKASGRLPYPKLSTTTSN